MEPLCSICHRAAAAFTCLCVFPPAPVCTGCLAQHQWTSGAHNLSPIQKQVAPSVSRHPQPNEVCDGCRENPAIRFCLCAVPVRKYCEDCDVAHIRKGQFLNHSEHPISAYAAVASGRASFEAFQKKQQYIGNLQLLLGQELVNFDTFVNQVGEEFDKALVEVTAKKEALLRDLQVKRAKLEEILNWAQQNIQAKRYAESFPVETGLDEMILRGFQITAFPEIKMYSGLVDLQQLSATLDKSVSCELTADLCQRVYSPPVAAAPVRADTAAYSPPVAAAPVRADTAAYSPPVAEASLPAASVPSAFAVTEDMRVKFHAPCREDFERSQVEVPISVGRHRLPIETLQWEYRWDPLMRQKLEALGQVYSHWRRSRGDGNCFYRCLGVLLLEHYCRPDTPVPDLYNIYMKMFHQQEHFAMPDVSVRELARYELFVRLMKELYEQRLQDSNVLQLLQYQLQNESCDKAIVAAMRRYVASYIEHHLQDMGPFIEDVPALLREVNENGREAEGVALVAAARCFTVVLHIVTLDNKTSNITEAIYGPTFAGCYPSLSLIHIPGHHDCLIRREMQDADGYDFQANSYNPQATQGTVGFEQFVPQ